MKTRMDFVTNSSSSSFIIRKKYSNPDLIKAIEENNLPEYLKDNASNKNILSYIDENFCDWNIEDLAEIYLCETYMDNFNLLGAIINCGGAIIYED